MRVLFHNLKIKNKIFVVSLSLLLIYCFIGLIAYSFFTRLYQNKIYEESANMLQLCSTVLDKEFNKIENLSFQIATNDSIQDELMVINENKKDYKEYRSKTKLMNRLLSYATSVNYLSSIELIDDYGQTYTVGYDTSHLIRMQNNDSKVIAAKGGNIWAKLNGGNRMASVRLVREKHNVDLSNLGVLVLSLDLSKMLATTLDFSPNRDFVIKQNNQVLYKNHDLHFNVKDLPIPKNDNGYKVVTLNLKSYLVTYKRSENSDLIYYDLLPYSTIVKQTRNIRQILILCSLFMLFLTTLLSRAASKHISKPLEELTAKMKEVQNGNFTNTYNLEEPLRYEDEIGQLHHDFKIMLDKINELIKENYTKQLVIKETEYRALQAQINPHFLYNTLDSINWLARINHQEKISGLAEALGNMMRNIISKKEPLIGIKEELEIVNNYITIQKYRYGERIDFRFQSDIDFSGCKIPKLTIQPIIENAIQHGLEKMISNCQISITIRRTGEDIEIMVMDNGPGIKEERLDQIYQGQVCSKSSGIGLNNIIERIKLMFGEDYGIRIESEAGQGTKVIIRLPFNEG